MTLQILVDPSEPKNRAQCVPGAVHSMKLQQRGWKDLEDLQKEHLTPLAKTLDLEVGTASKADTIRRAVKHRIMNPPEKE